MGIAPFVEQHTIDALIVRNPNLRWPVDPSLTQRLRGALITHTSRRGKYLLLHCQCTDHTTGVVLIHLGMSGSLRIVSHDTELHTHDHIDWVFQNHRLRYRDPRRFGSVLWHDDADGSYLNHPRLASLGIEPFDAAFNGRYFFDRAQKRRQSIKVALLSGEIVVGAGNIYACEALFQSKIHPSTPANQLSYEQCNTLAHHVKTVLEKAIARGGSTLKDFVQSDGSSGYFQLEAGVYDRAGLPCVICSTPIERMVQAQRATYFCPTCQPIQTPS